MKMVQKSTCCDFQNFTSQPDQNLNEWNFLWEATLRFCIVFGKALKKHPKHLFGFFWWNICKTNSDKRATLIKYNFLLLYSTWIQLFDIQTWLWDRPPRTYQANYLEQLKPIKPIKPITRVPPIKKIHLSGRIKQTPQIVSLKSLIYRRDL